jgi:hypothetical protein
MFDLGYWLRRFLHHYWKKRFIPSVLVCEDCIRNVQGNHQRKQPTHHVHGLGLRLTKPRPEQFKFRRYFAPRKLPSKVDLRSILLNGGFKVFDQGQQGSCTANCGAADKAYMEIKQGDYPSPFSRAFLYAEERIQEGTFPGDGGAMMETIGTVLGNEGICLDKTMPYSQFDCATKPSAAAKGEAANWLSLKNQTRLNLNEIKQALAGNGPVRFGVPVPQSFMDASKGFVPVPSNNEQILGGHAILCLGYDDNLTSPNGTKGHFIFANSWGTSWGDKGFGYLPYAFMSFYESDVDDWQQLDTDTPGPIPPTPDPWTQFIQALIDFLTKWLKQQGGA